MILGVAGLTALLLSPAFAHQGVHPTGLDPCGDAKKALEQFHLFGAGVVGAPAADPFETQEFRIVNEAAPGEMPRATVRFAFTIGDEHQGGYGDYSVKVVLPGETRFYSGADLVPGFEINPLINGWSGELTVIATHKTCGFTLKARGSWNLPKPASLADPCNECETLTCPTTARIGSVDLSIPLGVIRHGLEPVLLRYRTEEIENEGVTALVVEGPTGTDGAQVGKSAGVIDAVDCGPFATRVSSAPSTEDPKRFVVRVSSDKLDPEGSVFRETTVENVVGTDSKPVLRVTEVVAGHTTVREFRKPADNQWVLEEAGLRRQTRTRLSDDGVHRVFRWRTEERGADGSYQTVELRDEEETRYSWGWELTGRTLDPEGEALRWSWDYYDFDEVSGPNGDVSGQGLLQSETFPTGRTRTYEYHDGDPYDSDYTRLDVVKEAFAGATNALERRLHRKTDGSNLWELQEVWIDGVLTEKTVVTARSTGGTHWRVEERYPDGVGPPLVTRHDFDQWANTPFFRKTAFPDGTIERVEVSTSGGWKTTTIQRGVENPGPGYPLLTGTEVSTTLNEVGELVHEQRSAFRDWSVYPLAERQATAVDALGRVTSHALLQGGATEAILHERREYDCCGLAMEEAADGVPTHHFRDALGRVRKVHRAGLAVETVYDGLQVRIHRYPEEAPNSLSFATPGNQVSHLRRNLAGDLVEEGVRSPQDGSLVSTTRMTSYNLPGGIGRRVVTTLPAVADDQGVAAAVLEEYWRDGRLARRSGPPVADRSWSYAVNAAGLVMTTGALDASGVLREVVTTQFDWLGRALKRTHAGDADEDGASDEEFFHYDAGGRLVRAVDADGVTRIHEHDLTAEVTRSGIDLDGDGALDSSADEVRITRSGTGLDANGEVLQWREWAVNEQDGGGTVVERLLARQEESPGGWQRREMIYADGAPAVRSRVLEPIGEAGTWRVSETAPDGTRREIDLRDGLLTREQWSDANGDLLGTRTVSYDVYGRPSSRAESTGPDWQWSYSSVHSALPESVSVGGRRSRFEYDHRGRRTVVDEPDTVDRDGAVVTNIRTTHYWPHGGVRLIEGSPGYRQGWTYDHAHRPETLTTFGTVEAVTRWEYDPDRGWLVGKRHASAGPGQGAGPAFTYTAAGRLAQRRDARGVVTTWTHGPDGRLLRTEYSDGTPSVVVHERDRVGRIRRMSDAVGERELSHDERGLLRATSYGPGSLLAGWTVEEQRDGSGRLQELGLRFEGDDRHRLHYRHGDDGRLSEVESHGLAAAHRYHPVSGRLAQVAIVEGARPLLYASRQYDELGRLARISHHNGAVFGAFEVWSDFRYERDGFGRITRAAPGDGTRWSYSYNAAGELGAARRHLMDESTELVAGQSFRWDFDGLGNRIAVQRGGDASGVGLRVGTSGANALNQYTAVDRPGFVEVAGRAPMSEAVSVNGQLAARQGTFFRAELAVDQAGGAVWQPVSVSQGASSASGHLLVPPARVTPTHDAAGNLTFDGIHHYRWDAENRLISIEVGDAALAAGVPYQRVEYTRDHEGRLVLRERFDQPAPATPVETNRYLHAGWRCLGELGADDNLRRSYAWGLDQDDRLHLGDGNAALLWIHDHPSGETHLTTYDGNGNITGLVEARSGRRSATYAYSPFGRLLTRTGPYAVSNPFRFSSKRFEPVGDLHDYGHRLFHPETGRWLSRDPVAENGGLNLYGFDRNDLINDFDRLGLYTTAREGLKTAAMWGAAGAMFLGAEFAVTDAVDQLAEDFGARSAFEDAGCPEAFDRLYPDKPYDWGQTLDAARDGALLGAVFGIGGRVVAPVFRAVGGVFPQASGRISALWNRVANTPVKVPGRRGGAAGQAGASDLTPEIYKASLRRFDTPSTTAAGRWEIANTGPHNYTISGGGVKFDADGIVGTTIQEAKFITGKPSNSPFVKGKPSFIVDKVDNEFERMSRIIGDPENPLTNVEVIVNHADAIPYFRSLLLKHDLNGRIIVR